MFTPIKIQNNINTTTASKTPPPRHCHHQQQQNNNNSSSNSSNIHQLKTPVSVGSLSVLRLRQLIKDQNQQQQNRPTVGQREKGRQEENSRGKNISLRRNHDSKNHVILETSSLNNNNKSPTTTTKYNHDIASDLSALMGGAPVAKLFLHMMMADTNSSSSETTDDDISLRQQGEQEEVLDQNDQNQNQQQQLLLGLSPIRGSHHQQQQNSPNHPKKTKTMMNSDKKAKFLDEELTLKLFNRLNNNKNSHHHQIQEKNNEEDTATNDRLLPLQAVMHCREVGMKLTDSLPLSGNISTLLKRIIEILVTFGEQQHALALENQAKAKTLQSQIYEFQETYREFEAKKRHKENVRLQKLHDNSYVGLQERYKKMSRALKLNDDEDEDDKDKDEDSEDEEDKTLSVEAKDRKRMIKQLVNLQGLLAAEKDVVEQVTASKEKLQKRLDDQIVLQNEREAEHRQLLLQSNERYDELEQKFNTKGSEIAGLRSEIKDLQSELDDKIWLGTVEVESSEVAMSMLRKHAKDVEARCAITLMRLRQEQELVTKLKRKLNEMGSAFQELSTRQNDRERKAAMMMATSKQQQQNHGPASSSSSTSTARNSGIVTSKQQQQQKPTSPTTQQQNTHAENYDDESKEKQKPKEGKNDNGGVDDENGNNDKSTSLLLEQDQLLISKAQQEIDETIRGIDAVGGGVPLNMTSVGGNNGGSATSMTTPRPDKEAIIRSVPSLGRAQVGLLPSRKKNKSSSSTTKKKNTIIVDATSTKSHDNDNGGGEGKHVVDADGDDEKEKSKKEENSSSSRNENTKSKSNDDDGDPDEEEDVATTAAAASTASIVEALISIIKSQEDRIKVESRSWETAQEEADRVLEARKEKLKGERVEVEVQTEE